MNLVRRSGLVLVLALAACDQPPPAATTSASSAPASAAAVAPSAPAPPAPTPAPSASAAPADTASAAPVKDAVVAERDPAKEPTKHVKVLAGGSVALYLPEWAGTSWKITQPDKALGKAKEETIPGFAGPTTPAHAFTWQIKDALKGQSHTVALTSSTKAGGAAGATFSLVIDAS